MVHSMYGRLGVWTRYSIMSIPLQNTNLFRNLMLANRLVSTPKELVSPFTYDNNLHCILQTDIELTLKVKHTFNACLILQYFYFQCYVGEKFKVIVSSIMYSII